MLHGLLTPVMLVLTIPGLRKQVVVMLRGHPDQADQEEHRVELELVETPGHHRPESAPTRPSSAIIASSVSLPGGMPGPDYTGRVPYRSNIRTGALSPTNHKPSLIYTWKTFCKSTSREPKEQQNSPKKQKIFCKKILILHILLK